ncbi:MAG: isopentenyl phosphate kinase family protein [Methanosphaera stadtmanae]|nr:isopentenyl phosphate kinase family protein [Methanosphaera stadtmanae]
MIILKIGGSALTIKDANKPTIDEINLDRIVKEISVYNQDMIIVHGAGSYGHIYATEYSIGSKIENEEDNTAKIEGFCKTQSSVQLLNNIFCSKLQELGVPAIGLQASSFITTLDKRIDNCNLDVIKEYLKKGFVPVLYGDPVLDHNDEIKYAILSGDQIITYLAEKLNPNKVILSSDVDGIYTDNPKTNPNAKLIDIVTKDTKLSLTDDKNQADITGGMAGKVNELLNLAKYGIESQIINAEKPGNIELAVSGQKVKGTIIK